MTMSYADLLEMLQKMPVKQLSKDVTIYVPDVDEYYPAELLISDDGDDVIGSNHPYFRVQGEPA